MNFKMIPSQVFVDPCFFTSLLYVILNLRIFPVLYLSCKECEEGATAEWFHNGGIVISQFTNTNELNIKQIDLIDRSLPLHHATADIYHA